FDHYRERIINQEYKPGERIDSINRMMDRHGISRETAKIVLSKLATEGYIIKKAGKGSFVTFTREILSIWGIVVPFLSSNIEELINHLSTESIKLKREIRYFLHYNDPNEEMRLVGSMIREGYEAIMVVPNFDESRTADFYRNLNAGNTMIILLDNTMGGSFFNYVIQSYDLGTKRAFNYLVKANDKNFLFLKDEGWRGKNLVQELMEQSLQFFISRQCPERKLWTVSGLQDLQEDFFRKNNIGCVICYTDRDAVRLANRILSWKMKLPQDVSVVNYGNTELTISGQIPVTAVDCRYPEMARIAAFLVFCGSCARVTEQHVLEPELVVRKT
ncbi:MAG: substrate-binding domain-containing protein, partial [Bacteroidales bacterium]